MYSLDLQVKTGLTSYRLAPDLPLRTIETFSPHNYICLAFTYEYVELIFNIFVLVTMWAPTTLSMSHSNK